MRNPIALFCRMTEVLADFLPRNYGFSVHDEIADQVVDKFDLTVMAMRVPDRLADAMLNWCQQFNKSSEKHCLDQTPAHKREAHRCMELFASKLTYLYHVDFSNLSV